MKIQHLPKMLCIFLFVITLHCQDYKARAADKCDGIDVAALQTDGQIRIDDREDYKVNFGASYEDFVVFREDDNYGKLVKPGFVVALLFSIILFLASLVVFIILLANLCCCKNQKNSSEQKVNIFMILNIVFFVLCFVFLICTVVYSAKTESNLSDVDCASAKFASDLLEGVNSDSFFVGFNPLIQILQNFSDEVSSLKDTSQNFSNIKNLNLPQSAQAGVDASANYQTKYQAVTIQSGAGTQVIPITGQNMEDTVDAMKQEFQTYKEIGQKITDAATEGEKFSNQSEIDNIVDAINSAKKEVEEIKKVIEDFIEDFFDNLETVTDSSSKTNLGILIAVIVLGVIYIAILIVLFLQIKQQKCFGLNWLMKFVLILISFIFFIITILTIALCVVSYATDSGCNVLEEILTSNDLKKVTTELRLDLDEQFTTLMDQCVTPGKDGNLSELLPDIDFTQINVLLDGITEFSNFQKDFEANSTSKSIPVIQEQYEKMRDGLNPNAQEVVQSLATLNDGISCANQQIVLNTEQCDTGKDCKAIKDVASFTPPSCASSANLNTLFTNSKNYWDTNNQLMVQQIQDLSGNADTTPQTKFTQMRSNFSSAFSEFVAVKNKLANTIAQVQEFSDGFEKITNCRIVRTEFLMWEAALCFENKKTTYLTFIFILIAGYCILLLNIFICCTMRNSKLYDNENEESSPFESNNQENEMVKQHQSQSHAFPQPPNQQQNFYN